MNYFLIYETSNEFNGNYRYISTNKKDCEDRIMNYCDWYCPKGSCTIIEVNENFKELHRWTYFGGKLRND